MIVLLVLVAIIFSERLMGILPPIGPDIKCRVSR